jgi:DNA polymerase III subunit delta
MVAFKAADVERFVAHPDAAKPVALVFGPDAGLVHERSDALVRSAIADMRDPFALARIEGDTLAEEPERLVEEAHTVPLFGGRRAIWVKAGSKNFAAAVERLLAAPPSVECRIVIEAGDLRRGAPLRTLCERSPIVAALPCYPDDGRGLTRLIDEELRSAGLKIASDARALLLSLLGADRGASRSELRKLALYAHGKARIDVDDVMAIIGDASSPVLDSVIDAAFAGRTADLETNFSKVRSSGVAAGTIMAATLRQAASLHRLRLSVDSGSSVRDVVEGVTPKIHFSRTNAVQSALSSWSAVRLERLIVQLGDAALDVRQRTRLAYPIVQRALLSIAVAARRGD